MMLSRLNAFRGACLIALALGSASAHALPKGQDGFTADERQELREKARQALSKKMKMPIKVTETLAQVYDSEAEYVQVLLRITDARGKPVDWSKTPCDSAHGEDSPFGYILLKRQRKSWTTKGVVLCAVEPPDWRDVDFSK